MDLGANNNYLEIATAK